LNTAPVITSHPSPDELRAGFRRLLASCGPKLLHGKIIELQWPGSIGVAALSIVPKLTARHPGAAGTLQHDITRRTLSSATLIVPAAGERRTMVSQPQLVLRDLEAIFAELVVRDRQFQRTPRFAKIARSLWPLVSRPKQIAAPYRNAMAPASQTGAGHWRRG
jgi:hypothetical protein